MRMTKRKILLKKTVVQVTAVVQVVVPILVQALVCCQ